MHKITVDLPQQSYPIYIGENIYADSNLLTQHISGNKILILSNETIAPLYLTKLRQSLSTFICDVVLLPDGEVHKTIQNWEKILDVLAQQQHHRDSTLITLGGGVIGDMGGFAAASYQRGIDFIQIPTTLLAQVDASIGGKTAINHAAGKNLIGAFHQPSAVIIDTLCLNTLPEREFKSGLAEIVKAALIADSAFFQWLEENCQALLDRESNTLITAIEKSCLIKKTIVIQDEKELGVRALLNLGHTFAHAIEKSLGYGSWLHGEAVAAGLVLASRLSLQRQHITQNEQQRIEKLLKNLGLPIKLPTTLLPEQIIACMRMDKKVKKDKLRFILLNGIGQAAIYDDVTDDEIMQAHKTEAN